MLEYPQSIQALNAARMTTQIKLIRVQNFYIYLETSDSMFIVELNLRITEITNFQAWSRAAIQQGILQLQISVAYLLQDQTRGKSESQVKETINWRSGTLTTHFIYQRMTVANSRYKLLEKISSLQNQQQHELTLLLRNLTNQPNRTSLRVEDFEIIKIGILKV